MKYIFALTEKGLEIMKFLVEPRSFTEIIQKFGINGYQSLTPLRRMGLVRRIVEERWINKGKRAKKHIRYKLTEKGDEFLKWWDMYGETERSDKNERN